MSPRSLLTAGLGGLLASLALAAGPAHAAAPIELDLRGTERDHVLGSGDERERIRATGDGARLVLRELVECDLKGAHCGQLHRGVAHGDCEESLVRGRLELPRGALRLTGVGRVCAGRHDHERLWVVAHHGTGGLRGVHAVLEIRVRKLEQRRTTSVDVVSVDALSVGTLAIDGDRRARTAAPAGASQACILCELLVGIVHGGQQAGVEDPAQHFSHIARTCVQMPEHWATACEDLAETSGERIIALASLGLDATEICVERLGFRDPEAS